MKEKINNLIAFYKLRLNQIELIIENQEKLKPKAIADGVKDGVEKINIGISMMNAQKSAVVQIISDLEDLL